MPSVAQTSAPPAPQPPDSSPLERPSRRAEWLAALGMLASLAGVRVAVGAVQRLALLARPDPVGQPLVGKLEWYLFHAIALDALEAAAVVAIPALAVTLAAGLAAPGGPVVRRVRSLAGVASAAVLLLITAWAQVDHEMMRFVGAHLTTDYVSTYANPASFGEVAGALATDAGGPFLPVLLLVTAMAASLVGLGRALRRPPGPRAGLRRVVGGAVLVTLSWLLVNVWWTGQFRLWRLATPTTLVFASGQGAIQLAPAEVATATRDHHERWSRMTGRADGAVFPFADFPLYHTTPHAWCGLGVGPDRTALRATDAPALACQADADGDGVPLARDCNDASAAIRPGAAELPGNGVDEDCSGSDAEPWNVIVLLLESHRSMSAGHVGATARSATPELDRLAATGTAWQRANANGMPTIASFMAVHTGLLPHPDTYVATRFLTGRMAALPEVLRSKGFYTAFFSAPDPSWDNQSPWLNHWYDHIDYDRSRESDDLLFAHMRRWLAEEMPKRTRGADGKRRPFFAFAMTRTNHFPFPRVEGVETTGPDTLEARMHDTMRYTDRHMARFIEGLRKEPWFGHTVILISGDHGFPLGEHGPLRMHETAHIEATGVPIVVLGGHPELARLGIGLRPEPASHIDIAPTILDLLGIDPSGSWMGRSLVGQGEGESLTLARGGWGIERGALRAVIDPRAWHEPDGAKLFDRKADLREMTPLPATPQNQAQLQRMVREVRETARFVGWLYEHDRMWPPGHAQQLRSR